MPHAVILRHVAGGRKACILPAIGLASNLLSMLATLMVQLGVRSGVVSPYVSVPMRLRSSSGVDWRTGVDVQHAGSFTRSAKLLSSIMPMGT
jgi:hypothetical protein